MYSIVVFMADLKLAIYTRYWTIFNFAALWLTSILIYVLFIIVSNFMESAYTYSQSLDLLTTSYFYLSIFLILGLVFIVDVAIFVATKVTK